MKNQLYCLSLILFLSTLPALADRLTIHNRTPRDLYVAIYYYKSQADLASQIVFIESDSSGIIERPERKLLYDRELVFVEHKKLLKPSLAKEEFKKFSSLNVGTLKGDVFYIGDKNAEFYGYTTAEWNVVEPAIQKARKLIMDQLPAIVENPYKNTAASVRSSNELPSQEKEFLQQRRPKVKATIEKLLGKNINTQDVPTIALVCSGGGYRAMLYTIGALQGGANTGILDACTYMVGLSGSTWAIGGWMLSGKSIQDYHKWVTTNIHHGLKKISPDNLILMGDALLTKYFFDTPYDIVDLYGLLLANELLAESGKKRQRRTLSEQAQRIHNGSLPLPIYTAIAAETISTEENWYEFTPYEVGAAWLGMYVPSWAFGRKFNKGVSVNFAPEQNFGVLMGTFGLAIGITVERLMQEINLKDMINKIRIPMVENIINKILQEQAQLRITSSDFFNFAFGIGSFNNRIIKLVDAAINNNLPFNPVNGHRKDRSCDIFIVVDASAGTIAGELRKAEQAMRNQGIKFPVIDYANIEKNPVSMFIDEKDPQTPIVIYISNTFEKQLFDQVKNQPQYAALKPLLENFDITLCLKESCRTFNFNYPEKVARQMSALGEFNSTVAADKIKKAIQWKLEHKK